MATILIQRIISRRPHTAKMLLRMSSDSVIRVDIDVEKVKPHTPVMVEEVIANLNLKPGNLFLDMTFGAGGHTEALLQRIPKLHVFALDRDPTALEFAKELEQKYPGQVKALEGKFSDLPNLLNEFNVKPNSFDGILFDLGCSSMQLDNSERGFSISKDGPLDMRMDGGREKGVTAADVLAYAEERDLMKIFKIYGDEKLALKIARSIVDARSRFKPLKTTKQLKDFVEAVLEREVRTDKLDRIVSPATKVFQALRIFVNNEINELNYGIILAHKYLKPGGRAVVISFHSLEDKVVKRQFKNVLVDNSTKPLSLVYFNPLKEYSEEELREFQPKNWNMIYKKVILPEAAEVEKNPRCRSARLRVAEKLESDENAGNEFYEEIETKEISSS